MAQTGGNTLFLSNPQGTQYDRGLTQANCNLADADQIIQVDEGSLASTIIANYSNKPAWIESITPIIIKPLPKPRDTQALKNFKRKTGSR